MGAIVHSWIFLLGLVIGTATLGFGQKECQDLKNEVDLLQSQYEKELNDFKKTEEFQTQYLKSLEDELADQEQYVNGLEAQVHYKRAEYGKLHQELQVKAAEVEQLVAYSTRDTQILRSSFQDQRRKYVSIRAELEIKIATTRGEIEATKDGITETTTTNEMLKNEVEKNQNSLRILEEELANIMQKNQENQFLFTFLKQELSACANGLIEGSRTMKNCIARNSELATRLSQQLHETATCYENYKNSLTLYSRSFVENADAAFNAFRCTSRLATAQRLSQPFSFDGEAPTELQESCQQELPYLNCMFSLQQIGLEIEKKQAEVVNLTATLKQRRCDADKSEIGMETCRAKLAEYKDLFKNAKANVDGSNKVENEASRETTVLYQAIMKSKSSDEPREGILVLAETKSFIEQHFDPSQDLPYYVCRMRELAVAEFLAQVTTLLCSYFRESCRYGQVCTLNQDFIDQITIQNTTGNQNIEEIVPEVIPLSALLCAERVIGDDSDDNVDFKNTLNAFKYPVETSESMAGREINHIPNPDFMGAVAMFYTDQDISKMAQSWVGCFCPFGTKWNEPYCETDYEASVYHPAGF